MSMMLLLLVSLSCLAAINAQPTPCCIANQWSATMFDVSQPSQGNSITAEFYYDFNNEATATQYYKYGSPQRVKSNRVVISSSKRERYNIAADGTCTKVAHPNQLLPNCIIGERTYLGSSYVGTEASGLKTDTWFFSIDTLNYTVSYTNPDCILTFQGVVDTTQSHTVVYFNGYKAGITDPAAFAVPLSCL
ncbi:uncharacterized protein LOC124132611 isoform X2 [Haliotis rufescens]|uniref:uncharacterized protein LOC124132611 isoform X2 n=1 Tax=Haliotis rufescens TaxID=6454 RepID=UPI00201F7696|nr:uncharacterized protein LOC124132611 isoform X2 [Haliotis rufescens]